MTDATTRLGLPFLSSGQAEKELFHNEALLRLDALVQGAVEAVAVDDPPSAPQVGQAWVVGASPTGDWSGQPLALAAWSEDGWRFVAPRVGMALWSVADDAAVSFDGAVWTIGDVRAKSLSVNGLQVVASRQPAIADPTAGTVVDAESRTAVSAILRALRTHGLIAT